MNDRKNDGTFWAMLRIIGKMHEERRQERLKAEAEVEVVKTEEVKVKPKKKKKRKKRAKNA